MRSRDGDHHDHGSRDGWRAPGCAVGPDPVVAAALAQLDEALDGLTALSLTGLSDADVTALLDAGTAASARTTAVVGRVAAEADRRRLGDATGARNTIAWWARRSRLTRGEAARLLHLGRALDRDQHSAVAAALAAGGVLADQAGVIVEAVDALPTDLPTDLTDLTDPALRARAEVTLLTEAGRHDAKALRILGRRILETLAPEIGEAHEQRLLQAEEQAASAAARLTLVDDGHGKTHGRFTLPTLHGDLLRTHLMALANPRRHHHDEADDTEHDKAAAVITPQRLGEAFLEYLERYPAKALPRHGGTDATIAVTISLDALLTGLGAATLTTGHRITAGEARRLACRAGILPAILGTDSQVLDLGHPSRYFTGASRRALDLRDGGCTTVGCGLPPAVCHAHHDQPWSQGGPTDPANGRLLCPRHHRLAHDPRYQITHHPDRKIDFHRRT